MVGYVKYFFDTEFIEDGRTIDLISIGMVCEDGRELYRCSTEARLDRASDWVRANVLPQLPNYGDEAWVSRNKIRNDVMSFIDNFGRIDLEKDKPELFAYYADYDWVALCQLFGTMMDLPSHFPKWCRDLKQMSDALEPQRPHPPQATGLHNALEDARWNRKLYDVLTEKR
jgi:hypothetical protein